jgi:outer membrane receptor protein involved in Fe transport
MKHYFLLSLSLLFSFFAFSQPPMGMGRASGAGGSRPQVNGNFYGKVVESNTGKPIEYASVQLLQNKFDSATKKRKDQVIGGMITRSNGDFRLENIPAFGQYKLRVNVVGYTPYEQPISFDIKMPQGGNADFTAMLSALDKDLGNIKISIAEKTLENVTVSSGTSGLRLGIDRKVFGVDKNIVSAGGTAIDVMRNVPSINVDIDGNVTMRNNTPQLFVDGRPTVLTLEQIPADAIESVEIITNPSAKFDASGGTAGILNIILKKNKRVGYSGNLRSNIDSRARIGMGGDINLRQNKLNFFASVNFNQRKSISNGLTDRTTLISNPNTLLHQEDQSISIGYFMFFRAGLDYFINNRNTFSVSVNKGGGEFKPTSIGDISIDTLYNTPKRSNSERNSLSNSEFAFTGITTSFKHLFPRAGEEWSVDLTYNVSNSTNFNQINTYYYDNPLSSLSRTASQQQDGTGNNDNLVIQTDYVRPLSEKSKWEAGLRAQLRNVDNKNDFYLINGSSLFYIPALSVNYNSHDNVLAAYSTYSNQIKNFGYQLGIRVESSRYDGVLPDLNQEFSIDFPVSLFPSVFLTQKLKKNQDLQLNYTRKINRPNFFQLYPFTDYSDSLNLSRGNPNLVPEFTSSVELSYQKTFTNKDNFIASAYFKQTDNLITRYQDKEVSATSGKDVLINTFINANSSYVTGLELVSKNKMRPWWDLTTNFNLFTSVIKLSDPNLTDLDPFASFFIKLNNSFKLQKSLTFQLSGEYQSRSVLPPGGSGGGGGRWGGGMGMFGGGMFGQTSAAQGYQKANYFVDAALRFEFGKTKQANLSWNINDIFRTRRQQIFSSSALFVQDVFRRRDPQLMRLNFGWRFGKFDPNLFKRKSNKLMGEGMENINM